MTLTLVPPLRILMPLVAPEAQTGLMVQACQDHLLRERQLPRAVVYTLVMIWPCSR